MVSPMSKTPKYKIVAELRSEGLSYEEISERLGVPIKHLHRHMKLARDYGYAPQFKPKERSILLDYPAGSIRPALEQLTKEQQYWIASQIPTGMTIAEFIVSFVVDAYFEDCPEK